jgi:hypothetical protein
MRCEGLIYSIQIDLYARQRKSLLRTQQVFTRIAAAVATEAGSVGRGYGASQLRATVVRNKSTHRATRLLGVSSAHCNQKDNRPQLVLVCAAVGCSGSPVAI